MNLVVNNLSTVTGSFIAACCSLDMQKIALVSTTSATKGIWISTNKGATFTQTTSANVPAQSSFATWRAITCSNDFSNIIAVRESNTTSAVAGGIYYSTNSGSTWTKSSSASSQIWYGVAGSSDLSVAYAVTKSGVGNGGIFKSTDFGATWTEVEAASRNYTFVCCSADGANVAVSVADGSNNSASRSIFLSINSSDNFNGKTLTIDGTVQYFRSICCTPDFTKLAAVTNPANSTTKLWISTDSGTTWTNKEANIYTGNNMDNVAISCSNDLSHIVICNYSVPSGSGVLSGVYYSVDSGTTFRMAQIPGIYWAATCFSKTTDEFVAVSGENGIYRGTFVNGTTTIYYAHTMINVLAPNSAFSSYATWPRMQIGLSNSIHMPVNCHTNASTNRITQMLAEYTLPNGTGVSFWPTFDPTNQSDVTYFYWKYNDDNNVTTKYYGYIGYTMNLFTGQHKTLPDDPTIKQNLLQNVGLIMSSNDTGYTSCDSENNVYSGKRAIYINEALPNCSLSVIDEDPCVFGIITNNTNGNPGKYDDTTTEFCTSLNDSVRVNSLGEGAIWVSNINGPIQNGEWITSSRIPGVGKKQNEIRRCNYTVAKATMSCDFDLGSDRYKSKTVEFEGQTYVMAFISVTYHCG
jgi:hypothetical protein